MTRLSFRSGPLRLLACGGLLFVLAGRALAGEPVELRPDAVGHAGVVTLADLFDGVDGAVGRRVIGRAPPGGQAVLDAGEVQLAARAAGLDWANAAGQRHIIVDVTSTSTAHAVRSRAHRAEALVYARNIATGEVVQASDLRWSEDAVAGQDGPSRPDTAIGMAARVPLREGETVASHDLVAARVIRRDQMISVDYQDDGVSLSLSAKAMADAAVGDVVPAMNLASHKVLQAVATGPGHAAVGPGAQSPYPLQTASN